MKSKSRFFENLEQRLPLAADFPGAAIVGDESIEFSLADSLNRPTEIPQTFQIDGEARAIGGRWDGSESDLPGVVVKRGESWEWYLGNPSNTGITTFTFGRSDFEPVTGDWDGDGIDNVGVVDLTGAVARWHLDFNGDEHDDFVGDFGDADETPIVGDWDGNGTDNLGTYLASGFGSRWSVNTNDLALTEDFKLSGVDRYKFGRVGQPVAGDWNDDGVSDFGVVSMDNQNLVWDLSVDRVTYEGPRGPEGKIWETVPWGASNAKPLVGSWTIQPQLEFAIDGSPHIPNKAIDYGSVAAEHNREIALEIKNTAAAVLEIDSVEVTGPFELLSSLPSTLNEAQSATLLVAIDAGRSGPKQGAITIRHNASNLANPLEIPLVGIVGDILYVSFDECTISQENLARWSEDWSSSAKLLADVGNEEIIVERFYDNLPESDRDALIADVLKYVRQDFGPFNVLVRQLKCDLDASDRGIVTNRGRTTVFVGNSNVSLNEHLAGDTDVGNNNEVDLAFVRQEDWGVAKYTAIATSNAIAHEAGHTFGLDHVVPFETAGGHAEAMGFGADATRIELSNEIFVDADVPLFEPKPDRTAQNSARLLLGLFGHGNTEGVCPGGLDCVPRILVCPVITGKGCFDFDDFLEMNQDWGKASTHEKPLRSDIDFDGVVGFSDFLILSQFFEKRPTSIITFGNR